MPTKGAQRRVARARQGPVRQHRERIRGDQERRGVSSDFSASICDRLAPFSEDLTPELYDAVLSGVAMAYGVHRRCGSPERVPAAPRSPRDLAEVERLLSGFVSELRKLDEALETLSAYVERMRSRTEIARDGPLH